VTRGRGHVADRVIAEDREPTTAETDHLDTCPECFGAVRRRRPFDLRLADAARDLVTEPLPREVLLVDAPPTGSRRWWVPAGVLASFLLIVAVGVGGFVVWQTAPGGRSVIGADPTEPEPRDDALAGEEHVVEVPGDDLAFMQAEGGVMIVTRLSSPEPLILTKVPIPVGGTAGYAMVCPWSDDISMGFVYGALEPEKGQPTFLGPEFAGYTSSDGLFLYAFNPFDAEGQQISVLSPDGTGVDWGEGTFSALNKERGANLAPGMTCADWTRVKR
jgi:hypothetical protein